MFKKHKVLNYEYPTGEKLNDCSLHNTINSDDVDNAPTKLTEDWQWVDGYKCTDMDMKCMNGFQYELNKQYDIDNGETIATCENGFHFCKEIAHLFVHKGFPEIRFFKCKGLVDVNSSDYKTYGVEKVVKEEESSYYSYFSPSKYTSIEIKYVAKSIILTEEIDVKDTFDSFRNYISLACRYGFRINRFMIHNIDEYLGYYKFKSLDLYYSDKFVKFMTDLGYSEPFALLFSKFTYDNYDKFTAFVSALKIENLSKDMSVYLILEKYKELNNVK